MGDCSPDESGIRVSDVSWIGAYYPLWVNVEYRKPVFATAQDARATTAFIRIHLADLDKFDRDGFILQEEGYQRMDLKPTEGTDSAAATRVYTPIDPFYECRVPIR